jgi:DNA helicase-2/ATP-dependent DNA helicase PcrA
MTRARSRLALSLARRRMGYGEGGPSWRGAEPSRFLADLPPALFGLAPAQARPEPGRPVIRRLPGALPGEPVVELDAEARRPRPRPRRASGRGEPTLDTSYDQRPEPAIPFAPGQRVLHPKLGEGVVRSCDGRGSDAKVTVAFFTAGEKRVIARFLRPAEAT